MLTASPVLLLPLLPGLRRDSEVEGEDGGKKMDAALTDCGSSSSPNEEMTTARTGVQVASRKDLMVVGKLLSGLALGDEVSFRRLRKISNPHAFFIFPVPPFTTLTIAQSITITTITSTFNSKPILREIPFASRESLHGEDSPQLSCQIAN